jgi:hypothetical protein
VQRLCALLDGDVDAFPATLPAPCVPDGAFTPAQTERLRALVQWDVQLYAAAQALVASCNT